MTANEGTATHAVRLKTSLRRPALAHIAHKTNLKRIICKTRVEGMTEKKGVDVALREDWSVGEGRHNDENEVCCRDDLCWISAGS